VAVAIYRADLTGVPGVTDSPTPVTLTTNFDTTHGGHVQGTAFVGNVLGDEIETDQSAVGFNNGFFTSASSNLASTFDDIVISGPGATPVAFTLRVPFEAVFFEDWQFLDNYFLGGVPMFLRSTSPRT
jgi:hypothetical protein